MKNFLKILSLSFATLLFANNAFADVQDVINNFGLNSVGIGTTACKTYNCLFTDGFFIVTASIAILALGFATITGKIQWMTAVITITGIVLLGSAMSIPSDWGLLPTQGVDSEASDLLWGGKGCTENINC